MHIPVPAPLLTAVKNAWLPPTTVRRRFRPSRPFLIDDIPFNHSMRLANNGFDLENEFFWMGYRGFSWERKARDTWVALAKECKLALDIGANTGLYSLLAKAVNPSIKVHAFEPQPNIHQALMENVRVNGFDIDCVNVALSSEQGTLPFYNYGRNAFSKNSTAGSLNPTWRTDNQQQISVQVERLDEFLTSNNAGQVDLIKVDVETYENEVMLGYGELLRQHQPFILLEIQSRSIGQKIEERLQGLAYKFFHIDEQRGLVATERVGLVEEANYLLCPHSKSSVFERATRNLDEYLGDHLAKSA